MYRLAALVTTTLLFAPCAAGAEELSSHRQAWQHLVSDTSGSAWVVISAADDQFIQCANMGDFIRCPFPVSVSVKPGTDLTTTIENRLQPFPELPGSERVEYISAERTAAIRQALERRHQQVYDVYGRLADEHGQEVGTSHDLVIALDLDYADFETLVNGVFADVWGVGPGQHYTYLTE